MSIISEDYLSVQDLIFNFWACVDETISRPGESFFTPDGDMRIEAFRANGRDELAQYFVNRREKSAASQRRTRHLATNPRIISMEPGRLHVQTTITVFSGYGATPLELGTPSSLCDFLFYCVRSAEGEWLLERVEGRLIFAGKDAPVLEKAGSKSAGTEP